MDKKFLKTYFICITGTVLLIFGLWNHQQIGAFLSFLLRAFRPVFIGVLLSFVLYRPYDRLRQLYRRILREKKPGAERALSLFSLYLFLLGVLAAVIGFVLPQLSGSVELFLSNFEEYYENLRQLVERGMSLGGRNWWEELGVEEKLLQFTENLPELLESLLSGLSGILSGVIGTVTDSVIGLVISAYALARKEQLAKQAKWVLGAFFQPDWQKRILDFFTLFGKTLSDFLSGQLTEAVILGLLCFFGMTLFGFPYAVLISVIAGIANLVPIVGPIVGTVPGAFLLFLIKPSQALWFIVFMIVLQQLESNFIYPKVVGNSVGLPAMWVLISVIVGGSLFGLTGMLLSIPVAAVCYQLLRRYVQKKNGPAPKEEKRKEFWIMGKKK